MPSLPSPQSPRLKVGFPAQRGEKLARQLFQGLPKSVSFHAEVDVQVRHEVTGIDAQKFLLSSASLQELEEEDQRSFAGRGSLVKLTNCCFCSIDDTFFQSIRPVRCVTHVPGQLVTHVLGSFEVPRKVRPTMFKLPVAETMTSPPDSVTLIKAAAFAWAENDPMARNDAKVCGKILAGFRTLCWV